mmetsp:Transcript_12766/g.37116  ORF Transcript_12766/g.37116 Transcript_12766/m.37116 type:complete len:385 (+) Transcript_12766:132-1286(+)
MGWETFTTNDDDKDKDSKDIEVGDSNRSAKNPDDENLIDKNNDDDQQDADDSKDKNTVSRSTPQREPRQELSPGQKRIRKIVCWVFALAVVVTAIVVLSISFRKVDDTEYGLKYSKYSKILDDAAQSGGLHSGPPGFSFIKFPSTFVTVDESGTCVSRDGLRVEFSVTYQYLIRQEHLHDVVIRYRDFGKWAHIVEAAGHSAIQHSCAEYNVSNFQNQRGAIQAAMEANLRLKFSGDPDDDEDFGVYAEAISLQLRNVDLPEAYQTAVAEKQSAEEDIELAKNQRKQEITKAQTEFLAAKQEAQRILDIARNDADVLITEADLKASETTFSFAKEAETLASVKQSLNLTTDGVLAYVTNTMLENVSSLRVTAGEPATMSRKDEL